MSRGASLLLALGAVAGHDNGNRSAALAAADLEPGPFLGQAGDQQGDEEHQDREVLEARPGRETDHGFARFVRRFPIQRPGRSAIGRLRFSRLRNGRLRNGRLPSGRFLDGRFLCSQLFPSHACHRRMPTR